MILLQNITRTCRTRNVYNPIGIAVGKGQAGIAQVVAEAVLLAPGDGIGGIYVGIVVAAFSVVHTFYPFGTRARLAVFDATGQVVLYVLDGATLLYGFAQLGTRGIVDELDAASGAERDQRGEGKEFLGEKRTSVGGSPPYASFIKLSNVVLNRLV